MIFKNYDKVLGFDCNRSFPKDFTQQDRDAFFMMKFRALNQKILNSDIYDPRQNLQWMQVSGAFDNCGGGFMVPQQQAIKVGDKVMNQAEIELLFLQTNKKIENFDKIHNKNSSIINIRVNEVEKSLILQVQLLRQHIDSLKSDFKIQISAACEALKKEFEKPLPIMVP